MLGGNFSVADYFIWNELPTVLGNMLGGITFTGLTLYSTHLRTAPKRKLLDPIASTDKSYDSRDIAA
jgi:formate/nitrite transporter FocA (FNT family)